MSDKMTSEAGAKTPGSVEEKATYEPPRLTHVGNARDLLAGATGTVPDASPAPLRPNFSG
jgi:hypothetical protein